MINFDGIANELPDFDAPTNDVQSSQGGQDTNMGGSLSQLLSRSTPNSQTSLQIGINSVRGVQTSRSPGIGQMMNMGMNKNPMANSIEAVLGNTNKVATPHIGNMNDALVSSVALSMPGTNSVQMGGMTNTIGLKPSMGTQQMIGSVGSLNMGQQMQNQMMNGPGTFPGSMPQMRGIPNDNVNPPSSMSMPPGGMMQNTNMSQMQGHQGMSGHPTMNMTQNQIVRVSSLFLLHSVFKRLDDFLKGISRPHCSSLFKAGL